MVSLYALWERYKEDGGPDGGKGQGQSPLSGGNSSGIMSPAKRSVPGSRFSTPMEMDEVERYNEEEYITPKCLSRLLLRMREVRLSEMTHPACGRPFAINKMLERAQAAG